MFQGHSVIYRRDSGDSARGIDCINCQWGMVQIKTELKDLGLWDFFFAAIATKAYNVAPHSDVNVGL